MNRSDGSSPTAAATVNVAGPTNVQMRIVAQGVTQYLKNGTTSAAVEVGDPTGTPGIQWSASATSPSQVAGTYEWAQLIETNGYSYTVGTTTTTCNGPTGLDNS